VSFRGYQVLEVLDESVKQWGRPKSLWVNNGPEFTGRVQAAASGKVLWNSTRDLAALAIGGTSATGDCTEEGLKRP
jgi:hypothetical protein